MSQIQADDGFLRAFGERLRSERSRRGMSRKLLAQHAGISERYVTQVETGKGNVSILILRQIAAALGLPLARLLDPAETLPEMTLIRQFLSRLSPAQLQDAYRLLASSFSTTPASARAERIALIGLRGAGKTTIGRALAGELQTEFFELDREIERISGTTLASLIELYGQPAYRRYELQALQELIERQPRFVVATGGGIVSEPATFEVLLRHCLTVWLRATPEDHMARVIAQGDYRPMAGSAQAMDDLRRILEERTPLYARADLSIETSGRTTEAALAELLHHLKARGPRAEGRR